VESLGVGADPFGERIVRDGSGRDVVGDPQCRRDPDGPWRSEVGELAHPCPLIVHARRV
jgi:hypothetical protein